MSTQDLREWYLRRIVKNVPHILNCFDADAGVFRVESGHDHLYRHCLRPLAYLYKNPFEGNRFHGDASVLDKIIRQGDVICGAGPAGDDRQHGSMGVEWIPFNIMECIEWLGSELGSARRAKWLQALAGHLDEMRLISNYISTAPNHFIWRSALLCRAGQLFDNAAWRQSGRMWARQVCRMQTPDGYWDEPLRGHGPSTSYHRTLLHGLDLYYRFSGDEEIRSALDKGIDFAVRSAYPDGTPIETFDGRQPYLAAFAAGMAANALSRTPQGRHLIRCQIERLEELGVTDAERPCGFAVRWYLFATTDFMLDCCRFLEDGPEVPLPQAGQRFADAFAFGGQDGVGGGAIVRHKPWMVALCAAESDIPRISSNIYISERQSGWSIYHDRAGLIAGGGNRMRNHVPFANAIVLTGWKDVACVGGVFADEFIGPDQGLPGSVPTITEANDPVKGCYYPIRRRVEVTAEGAALHLDFLHGRIRFDLRIEADDRLAIDYQVDAFDTRAILLQAPIPLFWQGHFTLDNQSLKVDDLETIRTLPLRHALMLRARGCQVTYEPVGEAPALFTFPLEPIKNWRFAKMNYVPDVRYQPLYTVGVLSREVREPQARGRLLTITVRADEG